MPREVLVPGGLLDDPQPGRLHGTIARVCRPPDGGEAVAVVKLSDVRGARIVLPLALAESFLIPKPANKRKLAEGGGSGPGRPAGRGPPASRPPAVLTSLPTSPPAPPTAESPAVPPASPGSPSPPLPPRRPRCSLSRAPRHGPELKAALAAMDAGPNGGGWLAAATPGTRVWHRLPGVGPWPGVVWRASRCGHADLADLLASHKPGCVLLYFYGERSLMWVPPDRVEPWHTRTPARPLAALAAWARAKRKAGVAEAVADDVALSCDEPEPEAARLEARRARADPVAAGGSICARRAAAAAAAAACDACRDPAVDGPGGVAVACGECLRVWHTLCLDPPALTAVDLPAGAWACPACGAANCAVASAAAPDSSSAAADDGSVDGAGSGGSDGAAPPPAAPASDPARAERMGLTPDWIIEAACFSVFRLPRPSPARPYVPGLLDPCTNSKRAPNIPAQVLYDKFDDGLRLSNPWKGHYILLNPDFRAAVQWRFVNRAIDEVENGQVPAVVLVCRNSTDTGYFQRLRPYPRVLLRRNSALFKDYDKTPIGFGIVVVLLAKGGDRGLYERFFDAFAAMGEPNIPIDRHTLAEPSFYALLDRLRVQSDRTLRDHWAQCTACARWRLLGYDAAVAAAAADWTCADLDPPRTSCATPQTRAEVEGVRYAPRCAGEGGEDDAGEQIGDGPVLRTGPPPASPAPPPPPLRVMCINAITRAARLPPVSAGATRPLQDGEWEVLTSLELARQARIAANRAYLAGLGLGGGGRGGGDGCGPAALAPDDPAVLLAARELARKAAAASATAQLEAARSRWEAGERARRGRADALRAELAEVEAAAATAAAELQAAQAAAAAFEGRGGGG